MGRFDGCVAWITGATAGLGRALALELAREGADVAISGRRSDRLAEVAAEIEALGRRALPIRCDVTDEAAVEQAARQVVETLGRMDICVANAGFSVGGRVEALDADSWRRQLDVNVVGVAVTCRAAIPHLRQTRGRLALVGSVSGVLYLPGFAPYQASKAAVRAMGHTLAAELHPDGISVTTIQPGFVESEIGQVDNAGQYDPERKDRRPAQLIWKTEDAARVMVRAIERRKLEYTFTGHGRLGAWLGQHLPSLVHLVATRGAVRRRSDAVRVEAQDEGTP